MPEDDVKLVEFALGLLNHKARVKFEQAIQADPDLVHSFESVQELLARIALSEPPLEPSERLRERLLAVTQPDTRFEGFIDRLSSFLDLTVESVRELLTMVDKVPDSPWIESGFPGIRVLRSTPGPRLAGTACQLISMEPGAVLPKHRHLGDEWGFVLQGRAIENETRLFAPGDVVHKPMNSTHMVRAVDDEPCIFIVILHQGLEWITDKHDALT